jgi:hypothetical protein
MDLPMFAGSLMRFCFVERRFNFLFHAETDVSHRHTVGIIDSQRVWHGWIVQSRYCLVT